MAAVLSAAYPEKAPHFFAYMRTIVRASRNFEGTSWVSYDMSYRRAAANKQSLDWVVPDPGRFSDAFVGRAKVILRCTYCLSDTHTADECPDAPSSKQQVLSPTPHKQTGLPAPGNRVTSSVEICRPFNHSAGSRCHFQGCRFAHLCERCHRPHPASECRENDQNRTRPRSPLGQRKWEPKQPR